MAKLALDDRKFVPYLKTKRYETASINSCGFPLRKPELAKHNR